MKKIFQAAALLILAASAILAAAISRHDGCDQCSRDWNHADKQEHSKKDSNTSNHISLILFIN